MRNRGSLLLLAVVLLAVLPAGLLAWMRLRTEDRLAELSPPPVPVVVTVEKVVQDDRRGVNVSFTWGEGEEVTAPAWSGTVTAVAVEAGDAVSSGDVVVTVDGVDRMAAATEVPPWRSLRRGDRGEDVAALQGFLTRLGLYQGEPDGIYGPAVAAAVDRLGQSLGVDRPQGNFEVAWLVWLPYQPFLVERVEARVSRPVPSPGDPLLLAPAVLESVSISDSEGRTLELEGDWILEVAGADHALRDGELVEPSRLAASVAADTDILSGRVRLAHPITAVELPAAAIASNPAGSLCVWVPDGDHFRPAPVTLGGGRVARVVVTAGLQAGDRVLINPGEYLPDPTCP